MNIPFIPLKAEVVAYFLEPENNISARIIGYIGGDEVFQLRMDDPMGLFKRTEEYVIIIYLFVFSSSYLNSHIS